MLVSGVRTRHRNETAWGAFAVAFGGRDAIHYCVIDAGVVVVVPEPLPI